MVEKKLNFALFFTVFCELVFFFYLMLLLLVTCFIQPPAAVCLLMNLLSVVPLYFFFFCSSSWGLLSSLNMALLLLLLYLGLRRLLHPFQICHTVILKIFLLGVFRIFGLKNHIKSVQTCGYTQSTTNISTRLVINLFMLQVVYKQLKWQQQQQ